MDEKADAAEALSRNLHAAIERVREDVARVEFWAEAVVGFSQPVPDYDRNQGDVWLPQEQATALGSNSNHTAETDNNAKREPKSRGSRR